ncbi:MAG: hypothetical protein HWE15_11495 [Algoriphagus sp.]|uniref:hypothetical protein n=1 Tax=Algoriphagus sp. TaxID=1872435 RepID=UPI0017EC8406|nr:hypothetical protein [Algoriphagus sp.]NVJ86923.1 hypothetical protein [Algoriphagus sp.]
MKINFLRYPLIALVFLSFFSSCSCEPEDLVRYAFKGIEKMMGEGFLPSEEIRALGDFESTSVNLQRTNDESIIILRLENGDPKILSNQPEILARKCAEIYLSDFKNAHNYEKIIVQFVQTDPINPENFALQEHEFETKDFF